MSEEATGKVEAKPENELWPHALQRVAATPLRGRLLGQLQGPGPVPKQAGSPVIRD